MADRPLRLPGRHLCKALGLLSLLVPAPARTLAGDRARAEPASFAPAALARRAVWVIALAVPLAVPLAVH